MLTVWRLDGRTCHLLYLPKERNKVVPVYEFQCLECLVIHEHFIPFGLETADPIHCNEQMIKLFTPPAIHFKGKGFYKTDNR